MRAFLSMMAVLMVLCAIPVRPVHAARFSGAYLMTLCGVNKKGHEVAPGAHAACQSYISGIIDYHNMLRSMKIAPKIDFCIPGNVSLNRIQVQVLRYLQNNAQNDDFTAAPAVLLALYQAYPCRGG